jgi:hypothetical protein
VDKGTYAPPERGARRRTTVAEAAELLGICAEAERGRIRRGTLPVEREGGTVYVLLDPVAADRTDALISTLESPVEDLREQLRAERQGNAEVRRLLAATLERIPPQLEAPQDERESAEMGAEEAEASEPRPGTPGPQTGTRRPWWRRVFGG